MPHTRQALILLLALAGAGGVIYALHEPTDRVPPSRTPPGEAALPLELPTTWPASAARAVTATPDVTRPLAGAPLASPPPVGSEGYGPHIDRAMVGSDAAAAWEAVRWLRGCTSTEARRASFQQARDSGVSPDLMTQLMVETDAEGRRCQTVTAQHQAQLAALASRALRGGVPEAMAAYAAAAFPGDLSDAQRQQVAEAMRRDARAGDAPSLVTAATSHPAWGLSDAERLGFLMAYALLPDQPLAQARAASLLAQNALHLQAPPTPDQLAAARQMAQQLVARAGRGS